MKQRGQLYVKRKSVLFSKLFDFFTPFPRLTMSHLALNFVMQPCLVEWKWLEIYSFDSVWETSSIKSLMNSVLGKSSVLQLHGPWPAILPFFSRMSRLHHWMPRPEGTSVKFCEAKLMTMREPLLS